MKCIKFKNLYKILSVVLCLLSGSILTHAQKKAANVTIEGVALNFENLILIEDMSEFRDLTLTDPNFLFGVDSANKFRKTISLSKPRYFRIGRNILYLSPGDRLKVKIDFLKPEQAEFIGTHAMENIYLKNTPYPKQGSFLVAEEGIRNTIAATMRVIYENSEVRKSELESIKNKIEPAFYDLEVGRIKSDLINSFIAINWYFPVINKIPKDSVPVLLSQIKFAISDSLRKYSTGLLKSEYLQIPVYRDNIKTIINFQNSKYDTPTLIKDWMLGSEIKRQATKANNIDSLLKLINIANQIRNTEYKQEIITTLKKLSTLSNGSIAKDFKFLDSRMNAKLLSAFKGKVIYLDFWATWCGPCMKERPKLEELKAIYKNSPDVVILSISVDENKPRWKQMVSSFAIRDYEFLTEWNNLLDYNFTSIPRHILIDKQFKIVSLNSEGPGSENIIALLKDLSKK
jgi:thiol-disulfide isomerase/thioredoxin